MRPSSSTRRPWKPSPITSGPTTTWASRWSNCGRLEEGIGHFQKVLEIKPDDAKAHYSLGNVLLGRGQVKEAIGHFQKALEIQPDDAKAHYSLGNALVGRGQIVEAIGHYQQALEIKPDFADAYYGLGNALLERGQIDEAIGRYQKALEINPRHVGAFNNIAWLRATQPDPKLRDGPQAVTLARRAVELSPGDADLLGTLAAAYAETGRFAEAAQTAQGPGHRRATEQPRPGRVHSGQDSALRGREAFSRATAGTIYPWSACRGL